MTFSLNSGMVLVLSPPSGAGAKRLAARLVAATVDLGEPLRMAGSVVHRRSDELFSQGGGPPWQKLAERTRRERARQGFLPDGPILRRTGTLRRAYTFAARNHRAVPSYGAIWRVSHRTLLTGSSLPYAAVHQFGGAAGKGLSMAVPARPFVQVRAAERAEMKKIFVRWLAARLGVSAKK